MYVTASCWKQIEKSINIRQTSVVLIFFQHFLSTFSALFQHFYLYFFVFLCGFGKDWIIEGANREPSVCAEDRSPANSVRKQNSTL